MAFTAPRTWTDGELVTASIMNTHIRDNQLSFGPHLIVRKSSDQSVTSSVTLVNDTQLALTVGANEHWQCEWHLLYEASTAGDFKFGFTFPTGGRLDTSYIGPNASGTVTWLTINTGTSPSGTISAGGAGAGLKIPMVLEMVYINGGTAGTLQLQWAQDTSDATATKVLTDAALWAVKLA